MKEPLIKCTKETCGGFQEYKGQTSCIYCKTEFSNWAIASQLTAEVQREYLPKVSSEPVRTETVY
jgi:hypothetical protein